MCWRIYDNESNLWLLGRLRRSLCRGWGRSGEALAGLFLGVALSHNADQPPWAGSLWRFLQLACRLLSPAHLLPPLGGMPSTSIYMAHLHGPCDDWCHFIDKGDSCYCAESGLALVTDRPGKVSSLAWGHVTNSTQVTLQLVKSESGQSLMSFLLLLLLLSRVSHQMGITRNEAAMKTHTVQPCCLLSVLQERVCIFFSYFSTLKCHSDSSPQLINIIFLSHPLPLPSSILLSLCWA